MKPCRKSNSNHRRPAEAPPAPVQSPPSETAVRRYVHPSRTARPAARPAAEDMLSDILELLSRQSEQLEEVLRRLERDNSDTM